MVKRITRIILALGVTLVLAGCDKCGDPLKFTLFEQPRSCSGDNPQG